MPILGTIKTEIPHTNIAKPYINEIMADFAFGLDLISES